MRTDAGWKATECTLGSDVRDSEEEGDMEQQGGEAAGMCGGGGSGEEGKGAGNEQFLTCGV